MRIAHINFSDAKEGVSGAVRALMAEQARQGDEPMLFAFVRRTADAGIYALPRPEKELWQQSLGSFEQKEGLSGLSAGALLELWRNPEFAEADIVHLHVTIPEYFSYLLLPSLAAKPLVWSIYDSHSYTAGCYHTAMCERWKRQQCHECPQQPADRRDRQEELFLLKKAVYGIIPLAVVTPNAWLTGQVKESVLGPRFAAEIPPAIESIFFRRANRAEVRQRLSIAPDAFVVACSSPGGLDNPISGGSYVRKVLEAWKEDNQNVVLLLLGGRETEDAIPSPFVLRTVPPGLSPSDRCAVLQAADVFLQLSPHDATGINLLEAAAAGVPAVAFPVAAANVLVRHLEDGYLSSYNTVDGVVKGLKFLRSHPKFLRQMGDQAMRRIAQRHQAPEVAAAYRNVYDRLLTQGGRTWTTEATPETVPAIPRETTSLSELMEKAGVNECLEKALRHGNPDALWQELDACYRGFSKEREWERGVFVDLYLSAVIARARQPMRPMLLVETITQWMQLRHLPPRCGHFSPTEKLALQNWARVLRQALENFLRSTPLEFFSNLSSYQQGCMINLWRSLFFNDFTTPYLEEEPHRAARRQAEATTNIRRIYPDLLIRSMYSPFPPESVKLDMTRILKKDMPIALQVILAFWVVNVPYCDGDEKRQRIMRRNVTAFLQGAMQETETLPPAFYTAVVDHLIPQYWRAAYLGGNLVKEISLFGDFLHQQIRRFHPTMVEPIPPKPLDGQRRLRIGYISSNFFRQAVSFYMANRIFFADHQRFEVQVFSLQKRHDNMTDRIKGYSDRFVVFTDMGDLSGMAATIKKSDLDLLIYADIGMDSVTYQLAAMRLAPAQCVLVGHGATSGLPTVDYYLSGDFEAPQAQEHYRERLIRLPNLGAAQLPPPFPPTGKLTRKDFNLPEDAVLLVSCANGIKHGSDRDALLARILQQAPQAMIVLKPFMDPSMTQPQWTARVQAAARAGGVEDRLRIIPPLANASDLMDFLALADIQLDTYPYGGWTTNMEAVYAGLAVVTQEGDQARTRWGAHMLRALGIKAGIARNSDEYVRQAVELVNNTVLREQVRRQIKERAQAVLFNGAAAQAPYEEQLLQIHAQTVAGWQERSAK